jgi:hypothetical protein
MNRFVNDSVYLAVRASYSVRSNTTFQRSLAVMTAAAMLAMAVPSLRAAEDGVALGIVYDTSGSMQETVRDSEGKPAAKYIIANRALAAIAKQIQSFTTNSAGGESRRVDAGLFIFNAPGARAVVPFGKFDAAAIENWARDFRSPQGSTPLGTALNTAAQAVLRSSISRKHVLVITDGINTTGPTPAEIMSRLKQQAASSQQQLSVHFVAFDVDAKVFAPVKKLDATVVAALDEKQLNTQLTFILQKKILLEDEEPKK